MKDFSKAEQHLGKLITSCSWLRDNFFNIQTAPKHQGKDCFPGEIVNLCAHVGHRKRNEIRKDM
jgi:hypothetical protein